MTAPVIEDLLRELTPQVLEALVRRHRRFAGCEDAIQEAVLAAAVQWPTAGVPAKSQRQHRRATLPRVPGQPAEKIDTPPQLFAGRMDCQG